MSRCFSNYCQMETISLKSTYDTNKHWELYTNTDYRDAFLIGFDLSEQLDIDLLDATTPNDYKWIDKEQWREQLNETSS